MKTENRGRKTGDGRGRLGGRSKGTPNKDNPLKGYLSAHSLEYFEPTITVDERILKSYAELNITCPFKAGQKVSQFDIDLSMMAPDERVDAEIKLLNYHTPKMQAATLDMTVSDDNKTIEQRLADLVRDPDDPDDKREQ